LYINIDNINHEDDQLEIH